MHLDTLFCSLVTDRMPPRLQGKLALPGRWRTRCVLSPRVAHVCRIRDASGVYMNGASHHGVSNGAATTTAVRDAVPRDPVAELMEQVAMGRVRPMDAAAQVREGGGI